MKLSSLQLDAFFHIAKSLSFTKAAVELKVTQSALSQRIAKLEDDLETTLFIRDRTSVHLTEAGQDVLRFCQVVDSAESDLLTKFKSSNEELAGTLRLAGFSSTNVSIAIPALKKIMQKNRNLSIKLMTEEVQILDKLLKNAEADYIITDRKSESTDIQNILLGYEKYVLVKAKNTPETKVFIDHDENDETTKNYFKQNKMSFKPTQIRYLDDVYGLIEGVKNGYGMAVISLHLVEHDKDLEIVDPKKFLKVPVYLQFFNQPYYRKVHSQFLSELQSFFKLKLLQER